VGVCMKISGVRNVECAERSPSMVVDSILDASGWREMVGDVETYDVDRLASLSSADDSRGVGRHDPINPVRFHGNRSGTPSAPHTASSLETSP